MADNNDKLNIKNLRNWQKGHRLTAKHLDEPVQVLQSLGGVRPPNQIAKGVNPFEMQLFKVVRLEEDIIICHQSNGKSEDEDVEYKIALPYLLRYTPFNSDQNPAPDLRDDKFKYTWTFTDDAGATRYDKRTSIDTENDDDEEIQVITPSYEKGDLIFCCSGIGGSTGTYHDPDVKDKPVIWQDMNFDGRMWALSSEDEEEAQ
jgi:hypothetical protein